MNAQHTPYEDSLDKAGLLITEAILGGGTTLNRDGAIESRRDGYVVGGRVPSLKVPVIPGICVEVARWLERQPVTQSWSGHVGSWLDGDTLYVDLVDIVDDKLEAAAIGRGRGELAIYDLSTSESIFLEQYRSTDLDCIDAIDDADLQHVD
jgi:hypothetical protein